MFVFPPSCNTKPSVCVEQERILFSWSCEDLGIPTSGNTWAAGRGSSLGANTRRSENPGLLSPWLTERLSRQSQDPPPPTANKSRLPDPGTRSPACRGSYTCHCSWAFLRFRGTPVSRAVRIQAVTAGFSRMQTKETCSKCRPCVVMLTPSLYAALAPGVCFQLDVNETGYFGQ